MTEEQAVKRCNELIKESHSCWIGITNQEAIKLVLSMLKEKDKQIDMMAGQIECLHNNLADEFGIWTADYCQQGGETTIEEIKQYFENKAKEIK